MFTITVKEKDYKVFFGMNSFADTDLMDRVQDILKLMQGKGVETDEDVKAIGIIKDLFIVTRELYFEGFKKENPVETLQATGYILDDYILEGSEEKRGILQIFMMVAEELLNEGFLADLMNELKDDQKVEELKKIPQDHKKK